MVEADPPILPRLTTLNTNRGTWHKIHGMRQNAMRRMKERERKGGGTGKKIAQMQDIFPGGNKRATCPEISIASAST